MSAPEAAVASRAHELFSQRLRDVYERRDKVLMYVAVAQWAVAILLAFVLSPYTWAGRQHSVNIHVYFAIFLGGALCGPVVLLVNFRPGSALTRHVIAATQMLWAALLIHLSGGRIETHFHIFGSLAYLAFYRDWRVIVTATVTVAVDHLFRGMYFPQSIYGVANPEWWRFLEHAGWVVFEDIVLVMGILENLREMQNLAEHQAELEDLNARIEEKVVEACDRAMKAEIELRQSQKLESVGRLAAGVAHEINTPVQFVGDSIAFVRDAAKSFGDVITRYRAVLRDATLAGELPQGAREDLVRVEADADLDYLLENVPPALDRSVEGLNRVATIVRSMKEFAHPDQTEMAPVDLNSAIESTLIIARSEYKYVAEMETDFGELPLVMCHGGDVNQCILNIVVNAAHAIGDQVKGTDRKGRITVGTRLEGPLVHVSISDTGGGIPEAIRERVFDPFFTTKEVGRGTGQGLAITRSVIVDKHGGEIDFESEVGRGTTFHLRLPVEQTIRSLRPAA